MPVLTLVTLGVTAGLGIWQWDVNESIIANALVIDNLTLALTMIFVAGGIAAVAAVVALAWRPPRRARASTTRCCSTSILGMVVLVAANDLVVLFIGFELLSIPLYVLCATHMRREQSLESGLKYLIIGSVGSATLLYGLALLYGAAGGTELRGVAAAAAEMADDVLFLTGHRAGDGRAWRSRPRSRRSTSGRRTSTRARRRRSPASWRSPPRRPRSA